MAESQTNDSAPCLSFLHASHSCTTENLYSFSANHSASLFNSQIPFSPYLQEKWLSVWVHVSGNFLKLLKIHMERSKSAYAYNLPRRICIWPCHRHINTVTEALQSEEPVIMPPQRSLGNVCTWNMLWEHREAEDDKWDFVVSTNSVVLSVLCVLILHSAAQGCLRAPCLRGSMLQTFVWKGWALDRGGWHVTSFLTDSTTTMHPCRWGFWGSNCLHPHLLQCFVCLFSSLYWLSSISLDNLIWLFQVAFVSGLCLQCDDIGICENNRHTSTTCPAYYLLCPQVNTILPVFMQCPCSA